MGRPKKTTVKALPVQQPAPHDNVNHPSHYTWLKDKCGVEVIDITRHLDFCTGNAVKYLLRAGYKKEQGMSDINKSIEDLKKAQWYIEDRITTLMREEVLLGLKEDKINV